MATDHLQHAALAGPAEVLLQFRAEFADSVLDRPAGAVGQAADGRARHQAHVVADLLQDLQVLQPALAAAEALHDLEHPASPLAARRTLAARLMGEQAANLVRDIHDTRLVVDDRHRRGAQAEAADLARPGEVQRRVQLRLGHEPHADAAGDGGLGLAPLPHAAAVTVDELADRDAQGPLNAAGVVDVAADAVQLRAEAAGVARVLRVGRHPHRLEPVHAAVDDVRDAGHRFDVVDDGRFAEGALDSGE